MLNSDSINVGRHVVILGAGASIAAFPNGDKNGKELPSMDNLIETLKLEYLLKDIPTKTKNFEEIYNDISANKKYQKIKKELEQKIYDYFGSLVIADERTIYDDLILSLTKKDVIATFNWDPFLMQAYRRNLRAINNLPEILFLHGNVMQAYCKRCGIIGINNYRCMDCKNPYEPTKLLFPIKNKDYNRDKLIAKQWQELIGYLKESLILTIFGYSAPKSDIKAVELMRSAWRERERAQYIEIIDIADVNNNWSKFRKLDSTFENPKYEYHQKLKESWLANYPRQTCENYRQTYHCMKPTQPNPLPKNLNLIELQKWVQCNLE